MQKLKKLKPKIHEDVKFVNVTLFGGVGVGKSSFLNTLMTALINDPEILYKDFKTAHGRTGESKTKTVSYLVYYHTS